MATKLEMYQEALRLVGDLRLATITDDVEARYACDDSWTRTVYFVAAQGNWPHAYTSSSVSLTTDASSPGYTKSYTITAANWLRTIAVSLDANFATPAHYHEALGKIFLSTAATTAYVRYMDKTLFADGNIANWSEIFCSVVAAYLAADICERLTQDGARAAALYKLANDRLITAESQRTLDATGMMIAPDQWAVKVHNATVGNIWAEALRLMGIRDPKVAALSRPVDAKPIHQILEASWGTVVTYCLTEGYWSFATKTTSLSTNAGAGTGYTNSFTKPADWLRTVAVDSDTAFATGFDYKDEAGRWWTNATPIYVRYTSTDFAADGTVATWPDAFKHVVAARLAFECVDLITGIPEKREPLGKLYAETLARALEQEASDQTMALPKRRNTTVAAIWSEAAALIGFPENQNANAALKPNLAAYYQAFDDAWSRCVTTVLTEGYWAFATKTSSYSVNAGAGTGYSYSFTKPADWLRTVAVDSDVAFATGMDYKDEAGKWWSNTTPIYARHVSSDFAADGTATSWPDGFKRAVAAKLAYECCDVIPSMQAVAAAQAGQAAPSRRELLQKNYIDTVARALQQEAADQSSALPQRRGTIVWGIWNEAARIIGLPDKQKQIPDGSVDMGLIYQVFEDSWSGVVNFCLTEGLWNFASVTTSITQTGTPIPGWTYAFPKPSDWLRTIAIASDATFNAQALYRDEGTKFYANYATLYIRYISNANAADGQASVWPEMFRRLLAARLAFECAGALQPDADKRMEIAKFYKEVLSSAKNKDAMDQPILYPTKSSWVTSMRGSSPRDVGKLTGY